jgi:hypothetical protein
MPPVSSSVAVAEGAFDDQRHAEQQQEAVEVVEVIEVVQQRALDHRGEERHHDRRQQQRPPVVQAEVVQHEPRDEGAHHVHGAVREVHDVEHAEDQGQAEAQRRVERAVDQTEQQLPEQQLRRNAEDFGHWPGPVFTLGDYFFTSGHSLSLSGRKASAAGMVARMV